MVCIDRKCLMSSFSKSHCILSMASGRTEHRALTLTQAHQYSYSYMYRASKDIANADALSWLLLLYAPAATMCMPLRQCFLLLSRKLVQQFRHWTEEEPVLFYCICPMLAQNSGWKLNASFGGPEWLDLPLTDHRS